MEIVGSSGRRYYFVESSTYPTHVWEQGELGPDDSAALADILLTRDAHYRPIVILLNDIVSETETKGAILPSVEAFMTADVVFSRDPSDYVDRDNNGSDDRAERPKRRKLRKLA